MHDPTLLYINSFIIFCSFVIEVQNFILYKVSYDSLTGREELMIQVKGSSLFRLRIITTSG